MESRDIIYFASIKPCSVLDAKSSTSTLFNSQGLQAPKSVTHSLLSFKPDSFPSIAKANSKTRSECFQIL